MQDVPRRKLKEELETYRLSECFRTPSYGKLSDTSGNLNE
jgi:hypothetical protein